MSKILLFFLYNQLLLLFCCGALFSEGLAPPSSKKIYFGGGLGIDLVKPFDNLPGVTLGFVNFFKEKNNFYFLGNLDYFYKHEDSKHRFDLGGKLATSFDTLSSICAFNIGAGPTIRISRDIGVNNYLISVLADFMFGLRFFIMESLFLEPTVENKIGFSRRPDIVFAVRLYKAL